MQWFFSPLLPECIVICNPKQQIILSLTRSTLQPFKKQRPNSAPFPLWKSLCGIHRNGATQYTTIYRYSGCYCLVKNSHFSLQQFSRKLILLAKKTLEISTCWNGTMLNAIEKAVIYLYTYISKVSTIWARRSLSGWKNKTQAGMGNRICYSHTMYIG